MTSRRRAWTSRIVLAIATLACAATSRRGWHLDAELAPETPHSTPVGGSVGLAITVAASHEVSVQCAEPADPIGLARDAAWPGATTPVHYLCPPGTALVNVFSHGHAEGGGCSEPEPPAGATIHATVTPAEMWTKQITVPFDLLFDPHYHDTAQREIDIHATQQTHLTMELLSPPAGLGAPFVLDNGPRAATLLVPMTDPARSPAHVEVQATMYGMCPTPSQPCAPPADAVLELTAR